MKPWGVQLGIVVLSLFATLACSCGGGGGGAERSGVQPAITQPPDNVPPALKGLKLRGTLLRTAKGVPSGVRVTWERVTASTAIGYYLYRDDEPIPAGNPEGYEALRVNNGDMIEQPESGDTVSFDDEFYPEIDSEWYYRLTVVNDTYDESDFSNQLSVTISAFTFDSFDPGEGTVNDAVTLYGTNFGVHDEDDDKVYFTGASDWVAATITGWSQTEIDVEVPVGAVTGPIRVEIGGLYEDSTEDFTVLGPVLDTVDPDEDYAEHLDITLTGSRFENSQGTSTVTFNGVEVDNYVSWSDTEIVVKVPADATTGDVKVKVGANESSGVSFTVLPHIDSLDPAGGVVGDSFDVIGTGFGTTQGTSTVTLSGVELSVSSWGNRTITATVGEADSGDVVVTVAGNASNGVYFEVAPQVTGFDPTRTWVGQEVTISGTGFGSSRGTSKVYFYDGVEVESYLSWGANEIVVEVPAGAETGPITVEVGGNPSESEDDILIVLAPPSLEDLEQY